MASINSLPDDILAHIIVTAASNPEHELYVWREAYPLVEVSKKWQGLALPIVYSNIYAEAVFYGSFCDFENGAIDTVACSADSLDSFDQNASLISRQGMGKYVRGIAIKAIVIGDIPVLIRELVSLFGSDIQWHKVKMLCLNQTDLTYCGDDVFRPGVVADAFNLIVEQLPNLRVVKSIFHNEHNPSLNCLRHNLADVYSSKLTALEIQLPTLPVALDSLQPLTRLNLSLADDSQQHIPWIVFHNLKYLHLRFVPESYLFRALVGQVSGRIIELPSLEHLHIHYQVDDRHFDAHNDMARLHLESNAKISFPALQSLNFVSCHPTCELLDVAVFPAYMASVQLDCNANVLEQFAKLNWNSIGQLDVTLDTSGVRDPGQFFNWTSHLFNTGCKLAQPSTVSDGHMGAVQLGSINQASLTQLTIKYITCKNLLNLMNVLPNLAKLTVQVLNSQDLSCLSDKTGYAGCSNRSMVSATLLEYYDVAYTSNYLLFVEHFVLTHTGLRQLSLDIHVGFSWKGFLDRHQASYPHLNDIHVMML